MAPKNILATELREKVFTDAIFRSVFGREPNLKNDKNFLLHYLTSIEKTSEEIIERYLNSGISKAQLVAIYETGIVPSDKDMAQFPSRLLREWTKITEAAASAEIIDRRLTPNIATDPVGEAATDLYLETSNSVIRICHLLETGAKRANKTVVGQFFLYLLARIVQLLRSIRVLINNDESSSILILVRGMYECFGRLLLVNRQPDLAYGLALAGFVDDVRLEYCKNRAGRIERRKIRDIGTGKEFRIDYSLSEIFAKCDADRDAEIHQILYMALSAEVHPTAELLTDFVRQKGFLLHREQDTLFLIYNIGYVLFLVWREICVFPLLSKRDRRDAKHGLTIVRDSMLEIVDVLSVGIKQVDSNDDFALLFHAIHQSIREPYNDKYWNSFPADE